MNNSSGKIKRITEKMIRVFCMVFLILLIVANTNYVYASEDIAKPDVSQSPEEDKKAGSIFREVYTQPLDHIDRGVPHELVPTNHFYKDPKITIRQVVLDWEQQNILVGLDGVLGEVYFLRLSQADTNLIMDEQIIVQDGKANLNMNMSLKKGLTYTLALYDYYNVDHATFTWKQPFDFEAFVIVATPEFIDVPQPLAKTDDMFNSITFYSVILGALVFILVLNLRRGRSLV